MTAISQFNKLQTGFKQLYQQLPVLAGGKAVTFFKSNFDRQGWIYDGSLKRWKPKKLADGRKTLMKTRTLYRSIRYIKGSNYVIMGSDVPYAKIHNDGGYITGTQRVRPFTRRSRYGSQDVKAHTRRVNTKIEQRQFLGESPDVIKSIEREIFKQLEQIVKSVGK